jgi:hypothetical protein
VTGNKLEQEIIGIFNRDITAILSINQISKKLNKAYPYINTKVNELIEERILNKIQVGRSYLCSIDLNNDKAILLLSLNDINKREKYLGKIKKSKDIIDEIRLIKKEFKTYTILLQGKKLIFVLDHIHDKEAIKNKFNRIRKFELEFITKLEFQDKMLSDKSLLTDRVILYSPETYYELIQEIQSQIFVKYSYLFSKS